MVYQSTKRWKVVEGHTIAIVVESRSESHREKISEKGGIITGRKVYSPPLTSTYRETDLSGSLNNGM